MRAPVIVRERGVGRGDRESGDDSGREREREEAGQLCMGQTRRETRTDKETDTYRLGERHIDTYRHVKTATEPHRARVYIRRKTHTYTHLYTEENTLNDALGRQGVKAQTLNPKS